MADTRIKAGQFFGVVGHGTDGYFLMTNADGTMSWAEGGASGPSVTSVSYPGDDTAADPAGGQTVVLTGTNFGSSMTVSIGGTTAPSVAHDSSTQLTITTPAKAAGDYDIVVTNTVTGASGTFVNGISYNGIPTWTTAAGSLGTFESETTISTITLQATEPDGGTITFNITNGALPTGLSLTGANIDGTTTAESSTTLYSFTIEAIDDENQSTPRNFSITVNSAELTPSENFTINTYIGNGSTQSIEGKIGTAASFNGSSSKIATNITNLTIPTDSNFSISSWVKISSTGGFIFGEGSFNSWSTVGFGLQTRTGFNDLELSLGRANGSGGTQVTTGVVSLNTWYHIVCVVDLSSTLKIYLNGVESSVSLTETSRNSVSGGFYIGSEGTPDYEFNGSIDQVRFFNKALSSSEATTLYGENNASSTKSTTDIFDDGSGVALYEFEKGAIDTGGVSGYIGSAGIFNGSSSYILAPAFMPTGSAARSVSAWVKTTVSNTNMTILMYGSGGTNNYFIFRILNGKLGIAFYANDHDFTATGLTDGDWHHVVGTYDGSSAKVYLDGSLIGTGSAGAVSTNSNNVAIGGYSNGVDALFNGSIDQVRIFNKALSSSEVTTLYGETSASSTKSTTDIFDDSSGVALYELEGNANDAGGTYNGTATNVSYAYDGTPTNVSFVGTSFQPDLVWFKERNGTNNHQLYDTVRGDDFALFSNTTDVQYNYSAHPSGDLSPSITSNGFTTPAVTNNGINRSGGTYAAWQWKAADTTTTIAANTVGNTIASDVRANQEAGFSIVGWTGTGSAGSIGHGLSSAPELIIMKNRDGTNGWVVRSSALGNGYVLLNSSSEYSTTAFWGTPTDSVFSITSNSSGRLLNNKHIAYCFHSVDGYQKVGSYVGNSSTAGPLIDVGFRPRFIMVKGITSGYSSHWMIIDSIRDTDTIKDKRLLANLSNIEIDDSNWATEFNDNGFQPKSTFTGYNDSNGTYIYLAIA